MEESIMVASMPPPSQPKRGPGNPNMAKLNKKRGRKFTKTLSGTKGSNQKNSSFNYDPHRPELGGGDINRQTRSLLDPPPRVATDGTPKSPLKKKVKEELSKTKGKLARTEGKLEREQKKVGTLKEKVRQMQEQLRKEKKASNVMIAKARDEANGAIKEAVKELWTKQRLHLKS
jgi:hypothetical protein